VILENHAVSGRHFSIHTNQFIHHKDGRSTLIRSLRTFNCFKTQRPTKRPTDQAILHSPIQRLKYLHSTVHFCKQKLQFLPHGRSIGSWICLTHKTYTCHTLQCCACQLYIFFKRVTMYNNAKRTQGKLQRFISTVLQFPATRYARA
jgi:hypothetical protein